MAVYRYIAKKLDGTKVKGQIHARDEDQVYDQLKAHGLYLLRARERKIRVQAKPLTSKGLEIFTKELSVMLQSGIPLTQALNMLWQQEGSPSAAAAYRKLYLSTVNGNHFSEGMEQQEGIFPPLMIQMVKAGEESGLLSPCMEKLADYFESDSRLKRQLMTALVYPAFLFCLTIAAIIVVFTVVLPNFLGLFETLESLPLSTRILIGLSNALVNHAFGTAILLTVLAAILVYFFRHPKFGITIDKLILKLPVVGKIFCVLATARFARSLGFLYTTGVPMIKAVSIASGLLGNRYLTAQLQTALEALREGCALSMVLSGVDGLDSRLVTAVFLGEESGELYKMLGHIADSFEQSSRESSKQLAALAEPVMVVFLAVMIGWVMLSVMVPIYQYYQTLG